MQNDIQDALSGLLVDWHHYCQHTAHKAGYAGKAAGFGQARSNSQYDWQNNVESELIDRRIMQGFDAAVQRIAQPWHTALQFEARNLATGYSVWVSPRLPADPVERDTLITAARRRLLVELARDGVLC